MDTELWYIYAPEGVRAKRLKESRGYTDEKIKSIMNSQNDDETFRKYCDRIIENDGDIEETRKAITGILNSDD